TLALQPACTPLLHCHVSALEGLPPGVVGAVDASGRALLVLDDLKLALSAIDAVPIRQREAPGPIPSLMVLLEFEPAAPGLSFNAMPLFVRTPDRGRLPAGAGGARRAGAALAHAALAGLRGVPRPRLVVSQDRETAGVPARPGRAGPARERMWRRREAKRTRTDAQDGWEPLGWPIGSDSPTR